MNWNEVALDAYHAAQRIKSYPRSCISRAYYAAYSATTQMLSDTKGVSFPLDRDGPSHSALTNLVGIHLLGKLELGKIKMIKEALRRLYRARVLADYSPHTTITHLDAIEALTDASMILRKFDLI